MITYFSSWVFSDAFFNVLYDQRHQGLDAAGLVPVLGEFADLANGVLYTIEGDAVNAGLSFAAMIPFAGWSAVAGKYVAYFVKNPVTGRIIHLSVQKINGVVEFGSSGQLRRSLGMTVGDLRQAHHIIPWNLRTHPAIQKVANNATIGKDLFHMNHPGNGVPLPTTRHSGSHPDYETKVRTELTNIFNSYGHNPTLMKDEIIKLQDKILRAINNNPNTHINSLIF